MRPIDLSTSNPRGALLAVQAYWRLTRWLGPWSDAERAPGAVQRRRLVLTATDDERLRTEAFLYTPTDRPPVGSYLIAHGLHPRGPDDQRCDRFARILCHAGFVTLCPRLDALTQMRLDASAVAQLGTSLDALFVLDERPPHALPGMFSISFGSFPALMTAASRRAGGRLGALIVFGGYASFVDTCRFMIGAAPARAGDPPPDPTCMAGLAINAAPLLFPAEDAHRLAHGWRTFVSSVWGVPEMQAIKCAEEAARRLAAELPAELREPFLQGCGVVPGFAPQIEKALSLMDVRAMDPRPHLHAIRCPVHLFHGRGDNVIPSSQMHELAAGLRAAKPKTHLTGLYGHSRQEARIAPLAALPALAREVKTIAGMLWAMVRSGSQPTHPEHRVERADMYRTRFVVLAVLILAAAASRLLPHPPNFTPIAAMALFGGACFASRRTAFLVPFAAMLLSDLAIGLTRGDLSLGLHPLLPVVYGSFALSVCLGFWLRGARTFARVAGATLAGSILFFVVTNFGVWALGTWYPRTWDGLIACYVAAIPFFRNTLLGDVFYSAVLFGSLTLAERRFPALRGPAAAASSAR